MDTKALQNPQLPCPALFCCLPLDLSHCHPPHYLHPIISGLRFPPHHEYTGLTPHWQVEEISMIMKNIASTACCRASRASTCSVSI
ncbi:hypothetical protein CROQUDRAFT_207560 [Cronartium quercuum f. sp. fusiforme G11]|uniref:Uncharacterized protein n=1 Tax=Cronartium quercuum f. sp. fusiforme G11 TaxID=708437 RepID=A0A9P6NAB8_9BASI|nr:hypothetical protein CROQUDRAFT_207560 [Cronartium quercuum f. sp. fusiforme G11]